MKSLNGKVACITGATGGIGRALSMALAKEGCELVLAARDIDELEGEGQKIEAATGIRARLCSVDIANPSQINHLTETLNHFGRLDILINGAATFSDASLDEIEEGMLVSLMNTIARGTILVTKATLPFLKQSGGHVINFVTDWAVPGWAGPAPFSSAKWAVAGMGEALAKELIGHGIKVVNLFPGDIASDMKPESSLEDVLAEHGSSMIPLEDIVLTVMYVLSLKLSRAQTIVILPIDPEYIA